MKINPIFATAGAFMLTAGIASAQTGQSSQVGQPGQTQDRTQDRTQTQQPQATGEMLTLQGCLADDPAARGQVGAGRQFGNQQTFLLRNVVREGEDGWKREGAQAGQTGQAGQPAQQPGQAGQAGQTGQQRPGTGTTGMQAQRDRDDDKDKTYRLVASGEANVNLAPHVGHQIEVRGRKMDTDHSQHMTTPRGQTGQQAGQAGQPGQAGQQPGQAGQAGQAGQRTQPGDTMHATQFDDDYEILTVTSIRMISETCEAETDVR